MENGIPEHEVGTQQRDRVYVALYHDHIPKLVDEQVVRFDNGHETITPAEHAEQVLAALNGMGATLDVNQETHARSEIDEGNG